MIDDCRCKIRPARIIKDAALVSVAVLKIQMEGMDGQGIETMARLILKGSCGEESENSLNFNLAK
jgi:hypothetical protein